MKDSGKSGEGFCVKCGTCNTVCPVYLATGNEIHSPRGKQHLRTHMAGKSGSGHYADIFSQCLLCGACEEVCPRGLDTPGLVAGVRAQLPGLSGLSFLKYVSSRALTNPALLTGLTRIGTAANVLFGEWLPPESGMRLRLQSLSMEELRPPGKGYIAKLKAAAAETGDTPDIGQEQKLNYFTGCLAGHLQPEIAEATQYLSRRTTGRAAYVPLAQTCCGMAALAAGRPDEAKELARKNIRAFEDNEFPILTSCSSCYYQLKTYGSLLADDPDWQRRGARFAARLQEFSSFFLEKITDGFDALPTKAVPGQKVLYHDPCHLRFKLHITEEPRQLIRLLPEVELLELPNGPKCCGQGGLFQLAHPDLALKVRASLLADFANLRVQTVLTGCSGCLLQWQQGLAAGIKGCKAQHLAVFIAGRLQ